MWLAEVRRVFVSCRLARLSAAMLHRWVIGSLCGLMAIACIRSTDAAADESHHSSRHRKLQQVCSCDFTDVAPLNASTIPIAADAKVVSASTAATAMRAKWDLFLLTDPSAVRHKQACFRFLTSSRSQLHLCTYTKIARQCCTCSLRPLRQSSGGLSATACRSPTSPASTTCLDLSQFKQS